MKARPSQKVSAWPANLVFDDRHPRRENFLGEILRGLSQERKTLPPKLFYDEKGGELFLRITGLPEYYLTRTEKALLSQVANDIKKSIGPGSHLIEYGCGNSGKAAILIESLGQAQSYLAIDISKTPLLQSCLGIATQFPDLQVTAVCADFTASLDLACDFAEDSGSHVAFFPGSSIGNFQPEEAVQFLANARSTVGPGGGFLIGVDLKKVPRLLDAAYNDAQGVTAEFNFNLLRRINREAGGHFDLSKFRHRAFYDEALGRVEMHLVSVEDQVVGIVGKEFSFRKNETIHTENSYKYSVEEFQSLASSAKWFPRAHWVDPAQLFSLHYLEN